MCRQAMPTPICSLQYKALTVIFILSRAPPPVCGSPCPTPTVDASTDVDGCTAGPTCDPTGGLWTEECPVEKGDFLAS